MKLYSYQDDLLFIGTLKSLTKQQINYLQAAEIEHDLECSGKIFVLTSRQLESFKYMMENIFDDPVEIAGTWSHLIYRRFVDEKEK